MTWLPLPMQLNHEWLRVSRGLQPAFDLECQTNSSETRSFQIIPSFVSSPQGGLASTPPHYQAQWGTSCSQSKPVSSVSTHETGCDKARSAILCITSFASVPNKQDFHHRVLSGRLSASFCFGDPDARISFELRASVHSLSGMHLLKAFLCPNFCPN